MSPRRTTPARRRRTAGLTASRTGPVVELDPAGLVWHEELEHLRLHGLLDALARNQQVPAIDVVPIGERHLIIDGAHRAQASARHGRTVKARLRAIAPATTIPGWSHAIPSSSARHLLADEVLVALDGPSDGVGMGVVARLEHEGRTVLLATLDGSAAGLHAAFHRVAGHAYRLGHERLSSPAQLRPPGSSVLTWKPLAWEQIVEVATTIGPLPAGITRFASVTGR